jgi:hypothetical protein
VVSPCLICGRGGQREVDAKGDVFEKRVRCDRLRTNFFCCMSMSRPSRTLESSSAKSLVSADVPRIHKTPSPSASEQTLGRSNPGTAIELTVYASSAET